MELIVRNINEAFPIMWHRMWSGDGMIQRPSRNGPVIEAVEPVVTVYRCPRERVLFLPVRDCNPFFHLFESVWMLAGRNEVDYLCKYLPRMREYSDDGKTLNSAYGARWHTLLNDSIAQLNRDVNSRRAHFPIFLPEDSAHTGKDMPCNTGVSFYIRNGALDMSVFNRSNDMVWGAYGANVVHFSFLQEYTACLLDVPVGQYSQISSCFHLYTEFDITKRMVGKVRPAPYDPYEAGAVDADAPEVLNGPNPDRWQLEAAWFIDHFCNGEARETCKESFFEYLAVPMQIVWEAYKAKRWDKAMRFTENITGTDWREYTRAWLQRRIDKKVVKDEEGRKETD